MPDREKVIKGLEVCRDQNNPPGYRFTSCVDDCPYNGNGCARKLKEDALALLKEQDGLLGIQQTADSITFVSTGTAQQGESRGLLLGKSAMHEWLKKELLYRGLLTDDIRAVFDEAKRQEGR